MNNKQISHVLDQNRTRNCCQSQTLTNPFSKIVPDDSDEDDDGDGSSAGKSSKKERYFWQYNVQAKGPKGQKIVVETKMEDPHVLNDIVDPVFSGDVKLQGIKHRLMIKHRY